MNRLLIWALFAIIGAAAMAGLVYCSYPNPVQPLHRSAASQTRASLDDSLIGCRHHWQFFSANQGKAFTLDIDAAGNHIPC